MAVLNLYIQRTGNFWKLNNYLQMKATVLGGALFVHVNIKVTADSARFGVFTQAVISET
jgi:hypothetical protein